MSAKRSSQDHFDEREFPGSDDYNRDLADGDTGSPDEAYLAELHAHARQQYQRLEPQRPQRRWLGLALLALICLGGLVAGILWRLDQIGVLDVGFIQSSDPVKVGLANYTAPTATQKAGPTQVPTQPADTQTPQMTGLQGEPISPVAFLALIFNGAPDCQAVDEILVELVSGPALDPPQGTRYTAKKVPDAVATWQLRNTGTCNWVSLSLYSLHDGSTIQPQFRLEGETWEPPTGDVLLFPDQLIEVSAIFPGDAVEDISDEWVLRINDQLVYSQPHLALTVDGWVIVKKPASSGGGTGTTGGGGGGGSNPPKPPPTDVPPVRP